VSILQAIVLGAVQGATEFLPVSSSGHLVIMKQLFGSTDVPILFDVLLHVATLMAVLVVFWERVKVLLIVTGRFLVGRRQTEDGPYLRLIILMLVATVITGAIGVALDSIDTIRTPRLTSALFLVTALLLVLTVRTNGWRPLERLRWIDAIVVGFAQGAGVLPGISRSGITIATGLYLGMDRRTAGEFSFLLAIPAVLGALVLTLTDAGELGATVPPAALITGFVAALAVGYLALRILLRFIRGGRLYVFALYLVPLGVWGLFTF
jgi:undecaprenyl-diphosphatase